MLKTCNYCHVPQEMSEFYRSRNEKDGLQRKCKDCVDALQRDKRERIKAGLHVPKAHLIHPTGKKICTGCSETKPATEEFYEKFKLGHLGFQPECRICRAEKKKRRVHSWVWSKRLLYYVNGPRHTSRTDEPFDLTAEFLEEMFENQQGRCAWTGVKMTLDINSDHLRIITLDRLDNTRGYTADNVVLVCKAANQARGNATPEEFVRFLDDVRG